MSVQAEQLVYDFLSRVGDAAHGVLSPTARLRFVSELRSRIDAERARTVNESVADVRSLLSRLGDPELLVRAEASRGGAPVPSQAPSGEAVRPLSGPAIPAPPVAAVPVPEPTRLDQPPTRPGPAEARPASVPRATAVEDIFDVPAVPVDDEPALPGVEDTLPGAGGASIPPITDQAAPPGLLQVPNDPDAWPEPTSEVIVPAVTSPRRWSLPAAFGRLDAGFIAAHKREALATVVLFAGGVVSSIVLVVIGYAIALTSYTWSAKDKRFALIGLPALTLLVFVIGVWLEATGRWGGAPLAGSRLSGLLRDLVAVFPRVIGLLAALFFGWRLARIGARR